MAIPKEEAQELADLLPQGLSCTNARERLLCLVVALQCLTDSEHVLSNADLRAILRAYTNDACDPAENTVGADLRAIASSDYLGFELHFTPRGVWCERTRLTPAKVRLLLNALQTSRALTMSQSFDLQESLYELVSRHQEDGLSAEVLVDQRVRKDRSQVLNAIDTIAQAMRLDRRIEFTYTYTDFFGKQQPLEGDDGAVLRCETPTALYYSQGNYYVETYSSKPWRHGIELVRSRVDRMVGTRASERAAEKGRAVYNAKRSARRRMEREFDMVEGPQLQLFLRVRGEKTNVLFDRFGFQQKFAQFEGVPGEPGTSGLTLVGVAHAFTFYRWLSAAGDGIVICEPPSELGLRTGPWARRLKNMSRERLVEDYRRAVEGFLDYLDRARAPYAAFREKGE